MKPACRPLSFLMAFLLFISSAHSQTRSNGAPNSGATSKPTISELPATFIGLLPCADCPGIRYQLNLLPNHTFLSRMTYEERNAHFDERGSWQLAGNDKTLVLQGKRGEPQKFAVRNGGVLRKLDINGHEVESKFNYDLKRAPKFIPIETPAEK
jgi:copper homeostasis protein (lipoprotein)